MISTFLTILDKDRIKRQREGNVLGTGGTYDTMLGPLGP